MKAQMLCRARSGLTLTFDIPERDSFIGRERGAVVSLPVEGVSRRHARLRWDGRSHWIEDLRSTNGTFLNGEIVKESRLRHLDVVTLGKAVDLVFVVRSEDFQPARRQGVVSARLVGEGEEHEVPVGELTLGRSEACNVMCESDAISKLHARIERRSDQVSIEDLSSANGTLVNGVPVQRAVLHHGDEISLAGAVRFRVEVALGEVTSRSGFRIAAAIKAPVERSRHSEEWKTRFDWSSAELEEIAAFQRQVAEEERSHAKGAPRPKGAPHGSGAPHAREQTARHRPIEARKPPPAQATPRSEPKAAPPSRPARPPAAAAETPSGAVPKAPSPPARPSPPRPAPSQAAPPKPAAPSRPAPPQPAPAAGSPADTAGPPRPRTDQLLIPPGSLSRGTPERRAFPRPTSEGLQGKATGRTRLPRPASPRPGPPETPPGRRLPGHPAEPTSLETTMPVEGVAGKLIAVRLSGSGFELVASETGPHSLGRASDAALRVRHPTVSRRHARIIVSDDREMAYLQNAGGANGTLLNGREIERIEPLQEGDQVKIGDVVLTVSLKRL